MYIHQFRVKNYRSLRDVSVGNLSKAVIFYGDNDSGKSNLLSFLEMVFQPKYFEDITEATTEKFVQKRPSGFWKGQIENFSNNFYLNSQEPITFMVLIKIERNELLDPINLPEAFTSTLPKNHREDVLKLEGKIVQTSEDRAEMSLIRAELNQKVFYDGTEENPEFLSGFEGLSAAEKRNVFDSVMIRLDDAFLRIPPDRFLYNEQEESRDKRVKLSPKTLKNWLFQSSHDQYTEQVIREIAQKFNGNPFYHGNISIVRVGKNEIEAFVEDKGGLKLPIDRRGSGVQQILMILAYIAQSNSPFVGIEELEINLSPKTQSLIFNDLFELVNSKNSPIKQLFLTTHSPHLAKRNETQRRGVLMEKGETKVKKPSEAEIIDFFKH
jgi:ABC-type lipoprotein export system ATPase subunit